MIKVQAKGTSSQAFKIGKFGPTLINGTSAPVTEGKDGDLYLRHGTQSLLYFKAQSYWFPFGTNPGNQGIVQHDAGIECTIPDTVDVVIIQGSSLDLTKVNLPKGTQGKVIVIKTTSTDKANISIFSDPTDLIESGPAYPLNAALGHVTAVYSGSMWRVVEGFNKQSITTVDDTYTIDSQLLSVDCDFLTADSEFLHIDDSTTVDSESLTGQTPVGS
jgi:hypothetical protein